MARKAQTQLTVASDIHDDIMTEDQQATVVREKARIAFRNIDTNYLDLAEALFIIKHKDYYRKWGIESFYTYCEMELGIKSTKAAGLVSIWDAIKSLALPKEELGKIGFYKAASLARAANQGINTKELLDIAKRSNSVTLDEAIRERKVRHRVESGLANVTDLHIKYAAESSHRMLVEQGINSAKKAFETEDPSEALALLVHDWMASRDTELDVSLDDEIKRVSAKYHVDLVVMGHWAEKADYYTDDSDEELEAGVI
jgi:hypothetical protein